MNKTKLCHITKLEIKLINFHLLTYCSQIREGLYSGKFKTDNFLPNQKRRSSAVRPKAFTDLSRTEP